MIKVSIELKEKLLKVRSAEEAAEIVKAGGQALTAEDAVRLWEEIEMKREQDGRELSVDELESVSGGADRNWATEGCASTMEYGSWCGSNDKCIWWDVTYDYAPTGHLCPECGKHMYLQNRISLGGGKYEEQYRCKYCGRITSETYHEVKHPH